MFPDPESFGAHRLLYRAENWTDWILGGNKRQQNAYKKDILDAAENCKFPNVMDKKNIEAKWSRDRISVTLRHKLQDH